MKEKALNITQAAVGPASTEESIKHKEDSAYFSPKLQERWIEINQDSPDFNVEIFRLYQHIYQERAKWFAKKRKNNRSLKKFDLEFMLRNYGKPNPSAYDLMREDADRENKDWDRKYKLVELTKHLSIVEEQEEYGEQMKRLQISIDRMNIKRDAPDSPEAKKIHIMVLGLGGGMLGATGVGQSIALHLMGYFPPAKSEHETEEEKAQRRVIDYYYGISTEASVGMNTIAGYDQALKAIPLFSEICARAIDWSRPIPRFDLNAVAKELKEGGVKIDEEAVSKAATELWVQLTDAETHESVMVAVKDVKEGPVQAVRAACAAPIIDGEKIMVNGRLMIDGGINPLPLAELMAKFPTVTDIIIKPQVAFKYRHELELTVLEVLLVGISKILPDIRSSLLIKKLLGRPERIRASFDLIREATGINISILWPPESGLDLLSRDAGLIEAAAISSCEETLKMFGQSEKIKDLKITLENYK